MRLIIAVRLEPQEPHLPDQLNDRAQDNWEALLAIADIAGAEWSEKARKAALQFAGAEEDSLSIGIELLSDIKIVLDDARCDKITTKDLIEALCADDEAPWATYNRGKEITARQFSKRLAGYGIKSKDVPIPATESATSLQHKAALPESGCL